jgi:hypothetical protein
MSYCVNPVKEDQCLFVTYQGNSPFDEMLSTRFAANKYLVMKHWNRIVVDIRNLQPLPTTMEVIGLASDLSSDLPRSTRIALLVSPEQAKYGKLVERVARIEGMNLHIFFEIENAKEWVIETAYDGQIKMPGTTA